MYKKLGIVLAAAMLTSALAGCGGNGTESTTAAQAQQGDAGNAGEDSGNVPVGDPITLTFAHGQAEGQPYQQAALYFKELAEEESGGSITVVVSPNGTLGDERECVESLQMGTLDITAAVASALSGFDPDMDVFNMPYLFESREQAFEVLDGEVGQELFADLESQGIKVFGTYDLGFRSMTNSQHPIETPEDCQGIRIRTLESSVCVDALGALGMDAVSMSFSELFTALQTGAVDAQENPLFTIYNSRFYEVQDYLSLTEHFYPVCPLMMSEITWNKLSPEQQVIVEDALRKSVDYERELAGQELETIVADLTDAGMVVNEVDKAPFIEAVQPVYEEYRGQFGEIIDKIQAAAKE